VTFQVFQPGFSTRSALSTATKTTILNFANCSELGENKRQGSADAGRQKIKIEIEVFNIFVVNLSMFSS
jgi:hypothetical protein